MPYLRKGQPWRPIPDLSEEVALSTKVFQIRFTGEEFLTYDEYFLRLYEYMKPIWTCSISGKKGLTLEEALDSEKKELERLSSFSEAHLELICRMVHGCTLNLTELADTIHNYFKHIFVVGEEVVAILDHSDEIYIVEILDRKPHFNDVEFFRTIASDSYMTKEQILIDITRKKNGSSLPPWPRFDHQPPSLGPHPMSSLPAFGVHAPMPVPAQVGVPPQLPSLVPTTIPTTIPTTTQKTSKPVEGQIPFQSHQTGDHDCDIIHVDIEAETKSKDEAKSDSNANADIEVDGTEGVVEIESSGDEAEEKPSILYTRRNRFDPFLVGVGAIEYAVRRLEVSGSDEDLAEPFQLPGKLLQHQKHPLPKSLIQKWLRVNTHRASSSGSPFLLSKDLCERFHLEYIDMSEIKGSTPSRRRSRDSVDDFSNVLDSRELKRQKKILERVERRERKRREREEQKRLERQYPMEDHLIEHRPPEHSESQRPSMEEVPEIIGTVFGDILYVWNFVKFFSSVLRLSVFPWETLVEALLSTLPTCLLREIHSRLLSMLMEDDEDFQKALHRSDITDIDKEWQKVLLVYLDHSDALTDIDEFSSSLGSVWKNILQKLHTSNYFSLTIGERVKVLRVLVDEVCFADAIREILEFNAVQSIELLREKRRLDAEDRQKMKDAIDELKQQKDDLVKILDDINMDSVNLMMMRSSSASFENDPLMSVSRQEAIEMRKKAEREAAKAQTIRADIERLDGLEKRAIVECEKSIETRQKDLSAELTRYACRLDPIGVDRHGCRFWFFDGDRAPKIYVEDPRGAKNVKKGLEGLVTKTTTSSTSSPLSSPPSSGVGSTFGKENVHWLFIDTLEQVESIISYLDRRGINERSLHDELVELLPVVKKKLENKEDSWTFGDGAHHIQRRMTRSLSSGFTGPDVMDYINHFAPISTSTSTSTTAATTTTKTTTSIPSSSSSSSPSPLPSSTAASVFTRTRSASRN
eukprot:TRINITY_DN1201_c0_g1_i1.p1 TRINITY_DN1201_c0_g1~~TRINITY_DN1201_c0_g1_i1.p1  ORF type:complete len:979 (+),score=273.53 TRINITY_DN1201_c0_g1_i1:213-3149(+)